MDIALAVGGSFLSSFLQVLFDRMARPEFLNLFRERKHEYQGILGKLERKLLILQNVLDDAENKQTRNWAVKMWLEKLQEVLLQADDLLDQINTEALRVKVESQYSSSTVQVSSSTEPSNFSVEFLKEIMPKLAEILCKLEDFEKEIRSLGLRKSVSKKRPSRLPSTSSVDEDALYGRDADKKNIIQALLSDVSNGENVPVISIVGLGGVGKTTLAQHVYKDKEVNKHFEKKAWVCISEEYDPRRITQDLLNELKISVQPQDTLNSLEEKLKKGLHERKFFLVLDDIWNRNYGDWSRLYALFSGGKKGSKIIVTTRDEDVGKMIDGRHLHNLNLLSEDDSWSLFKKHALGNRDDIFKYLESRREEILKKCGGLPLAVKVVAGLLKSKVSIEECNYTLGSDEWKQKGILSLLRLSYIHLSSHLKQCFAYCAVFHKDYNFSKDEVIWLWMANDLLVIPESNRRLEDIGHEFFRELTFRSLFQQSSDGKFSMHDLVNDLAKSVSGNYFVRLEDDQQRSCSFSIARHFSYLISYGDVFQKFKKLNDSKFLRTFLPLHFSGYRSMVNRLSQKFLLEVLPLSKSLRVLSLSGYAITELPESFANLKQLRLLNLSYTNIEELPSWICTFYNLQTLLLTGCYNLEVFPEGMEKLINLRHLNVEGVPLTKMPLEIGRLENLQFLSTFVVTKYSGSRIEELGKLHNLYGELTISGLENVGNGKNTSMAKMKDKEYIKKLTLKWKGDCDDSQLVLDVLQELQPHSNIQHLVIDGYCGTRFPDWLENPSFCHIISLSLSKCQNCFCLPAIGQLPSLKYLSISYLSKVIQMGEEIYGNTRVTKPFPCLTELSITAMEELREWHILGNEVFSCLEMLRIHNCPKLIGEIPKQLPSLRRLEFVECPKLIGEIPKQLPSLRRLEIWRSPGFVNSEGGLTIFDSKTDFSSLGELSIGGLTKLKELSSSDLNKLLPCLKALYMRRCDDIASFPINRLPTTLKELVIFGCPNLELETNETTQVVSIESLIIYGEANKTNLSRGCPFPCLRHFQVGGVGNIDELLSVPAGNQNLNSMQSILIQGCDNLMSFAVGGLSAPYLTDIHLYDCPKLKSFPGRMSTLLPSLRHLHVFSCPEIECFPEGGLPCSLQSFFIGHNCERLWRCRREWGLQTLPSLTSFTLDGTNGEEETFPPEDLLLPSILTSLQLEDLKNLKTLNYGVLQDLTSLESLSIEHCPNLLSLPEEGLPASISKLTILCCGLKKRSLEQEWSKVAHIPFIEVDLQLIP